jgi:hypothetical protein
MLSPNVIVGAVKLLSNNPDAEKIAQAIPLPLYIAALFMGLTQPIIPGLSQFQVAQRNFFHDRIEVPRRIIDVSESLMVAIDARAGSNKQQLVDEIRKLVSDKFLTGLEAYGDLPFYKLQLDKLGIASGALETMIQDSSVKELHALIERLVLCALVAVSRKSGPKPLTKVAQTLGVTLADLRRNNVGPRIAGLIASSVLFLAGLLLIAELLLSLAGPIDAMFGKTVAEGLWPSTLDFSFNELWSIALPIVICMFIAVSRLVPREETRASEPDTDDESSLFDNFLEFVQSKASILLLCILATVALKFGLMFWEFGTVKLPPEVRSPLQLTLPVLQSFITVAVCLFTIWYLATSMHKDQGRGPSFLLAILLIAGATGFLALLYDFAFLDQYLNAHPDSRPGTEHYVFTIVANILVSVCAFLSVVVFFKGRKFKQPASKVSARTEVPNLSTLVPPVPAPPLAPADVAEAAREHAVR